MNDDALIGHSGFVGTTLQRQRAFGALFRSNNISDITAGEYETVVCAGAPAQKWIANSAPAEDRANIQRLIDNLEALRCRRFVLISTVDVFGAPVGVDERTPVKIDGLHPYGLHRRMLEEAVERIFDEFLVVRLPGLVGPGLRKNVVFDLLNDNNLSSVDSRARYQFYPMVNLWYDIDRALEAGLRLVHLTAEPVSVSEVALEGFGRAFDNEVSSNPANYDFRSTHAGLFGGQGAYQYDRRATLMAIRSYAQSDKPSSRQNAQ